MKPPKIPRTDLKTSLVRFEAAMNQVKTVVLERDEEVAALSLCILTGQHMMLEGPHGIAKSMLAREVTRRITGSTLFEKQFMAGTNADEVFGPMNVKAYREEGRYEHNIEGYLPSAHFFFGDEVYRASASMLGSLMGMLNERTYHNGNVVLRCPLITAIGTTNFTTQSDELEAFHDRWLVTSKLKALSQASLRRKMLSNFHARLVAQEDAGTDADELATVPLSDINNIRAHAGEIEVEPEILELFEELLRVASKNIGNQFYLSDRRACLTFNIALMNALKDRDNRDMLLKPEHLEVSRYGMVTINDVSRNQSFDQAYEKVVGTYEKNAEEIKAAKLTLERAKKMCAMYDKSLIKPHLKKLYSRMDELHDAITGMDGDEAPTLDSTRGMYAECLSSLKQAMLDMEELPKMSEIVRDYKANKVDDMDAEEKARRAVSAFTGAPADPNSPVDSDGNAIPEFATGTAKEDEEEEETKKPPLFIRPPKPKGK